MTHDGGDIHWMSRAIELARKGKGYTAPNPAVGAVIVKDGKLIGEGWHKKAGTPHAEANAIASLQTSAAGATIYVTLEPCNHHGRTPPCAEAIIAAGISEVVIGAKDVSPKKGLKGAARLKKAGITVRTGVMREECETLVEDFTKHSTTGAPFVTLKTAMTLDGKIATNSWDSKWISSEQSRKIVHAMRNESGAVMVGADTVIYDDPQLTVRHGTRRRNPLRVIVDGRGRIPDDCGILKTAREIPTIIAVTAKTPAAKIKTFGNSGAETLVTPGRGSRVDLAWLLQSLGARGVMSVLVESGGALAGALLEAGLVDKVVFFIAMKLAGGTRCALSGGGVEKMADAWNLRDVKIEITGGDLMVTGKVGG